MPERINVRCNVEKKDSLHIVKAQISLCIMYTVYICTLSLIYYIEGWSQDCSKSDGCFSQYLISSPWRCYEDYNISFCKQWKFRCHCSYEQWRAMAPKFALFTKGSKLPLNKSFKHMFELLQSCDQPSILYQHMQSVHNPVILSVVWGDCLDAQVDPCFPFSLGKEGIQINSSTKIYLVHLGT